MYGQRISTKEDRLKIRESQFTRLVEQGWQREDYKDLVIFTNEEVREKSRTGMAYGFKTFKGTSTNHMDYQYYAQKEVRDKKVVERREWADRHEQYKQDEKGKRKLSGTAACAAAIKAELKEKYPAIKFSVTSPHSVHVKWTLGPDEGEIKALLGKYEMGNFNGMEDIYEYNNVREDIPQTQYVFENQEWSNDFTFRLAKFISDNNSYSGVPKLEDISELSTRWPNGESMYGADSWSQLVHIRLRTSNFVTQDENAILLLSVHDCENYHDGVYFEYEVAGKVYRTDKSIMDAKPEKRRPVAAAKNTLPEQTTGSRVQVLDLNKYTMAVVGQLEAQKNGQTLGALLSSIGGRHSRKIAYNGGEVEGYLFLKDNLALVKDELTKFFA